MKSVIDSANTQTIGSTDKSLKEILKEANTANKSKIPAEIAAQMEQANQQLKSFNFREKTLQLGDDFPVVDTLINHKNQAIALHELVSGKKMIISFYRGSWCPYCNLEINYYNRLLSLPENSDVNMIAISPEKPDVTIQSKDIDALHFTVLSDTNNTLARRLNLVFGLPEKIQAIYAKFGIDLDASQGNTERELPIPATFVVNSQGKVVYVDLDEDYTTRPDAKDVILAYKNAE